MKIHAYMASLTSWLVLFRHLIVACFIAIFAAYLSVLTDIFGLPVALIIVSFFSILARIRIVANLHLVLDSQAELNKIEKYTLAKDIVLIDEIGEVYGDYLQVIQASRLKESPELYIYSSKKESNAFSVGTLSRGAVIMTIPFLLKYSADARKGAFAHELKHIINQDSIFGFFVFRLRKLIRVATPITLVLALLDHHWPIVVLLFVLTYIILPLFNIQRGKISEHLADAYAVSLGFGKELITYLVQYAAAKKKTPLTSKIFFVFTDHPDVFNRIERISHFI